MRAIALGLGLLLAVHAVGQGTTGDGPKKSTPRKVQTSNDPVTRGEARATFIRAEQAFRKALKMPEGPTGVALPDGTEPVGRDAIVAEMTRFYDQFKSKVKLTPRPVTFDAMRLKMTGPQRLNLEKLIRMGGIAKLGPLATGPGNVLTVPEFGDAIGFFLSRLAQMTHLPNNKWTPSLRGEDGS